MKNICFFCGDITRCGGTERISILLANEWIKNDGMKVVFLSLTESNSEPYFYLDSRVRRFRLFQRNVPFKLFLLPIIFKLFLFLRREKISVLIDVDVILSAASVFAAAPLGMKWISWEHFHFHENVGCRLRDYARKLAKRFASAIVVLTENDRLQYLETPSKAKVVRIANAVPPPMDDIRDNVCHKIPETPFLLSVGRLAYQKGFERIPALAARVLKRHPGWKWVIVGDGIFRRRIQEEIETMGLQDSLILAGRDNPFPYYRKAELLGLQIPDEVSEYIANRLKNNIRQLEGAVKKLNAYKQLAGSPPSILIAQNAIRDILNDNQPIPITVERIISEVSRTYGVSPADIRSSKRSAQVSTARQISMYIVREITQMSMSTIGEEFGGRDHSTVVYAIQQVEKNMKQDSRFKETVEDIIKNIRDR